MYITYSTQTNTAAAPPGSNELEHPVGEDEYPSEHFLLVQLHELVVVVVGAHVDHPVHVQVEVVDRRRVLHATNMQPTTHHNATQCSETQCAMQSREMKRSE